jgi:hypothetical protein
MQIVINDELIQQTMLAFNTNNAQFASEKALHFFLQANKSQQVVKSKNPLKGSLIFENDSVSPLGVEWNAEQ